MALDDLLSDIRAGKQIVDPLCSLAGMYTGLMTLAVGMATKAENPEYLTSGYALMALGASIIVGSVVANGKY